MSLHDPVRALETERAYNAYRAWQRRELYRNDPIYRLTKLKDCWERRQRKRRREESPK